MNLEGIMITKISKAWKDKYCMIFICETKENFKTTNSIETGTGVVVVRDSGLGSLARW
jgi:hypothetical protein